MILTSSIIVPSASDAVLIENGAVAIIKGVIRATGPLESIVKRFPNQQIHQFRNCVLLPGLINLHTHIELPALLHKIKADTFPDWILHLIRVKKGLHDTDYSSSARENIETLLRTGTTTVGDICTHGESLPLLRKSGLRAMIFHEIISMGPMDKGHEGPKLNVRISKERRTSNLIHQGLSPHSPYTVSEIMLRQIKKMAKTHTFMLCMHVAESKDEIRLLQGGKSGLTKLYQLANWNPSWAPIASSSFEYLQRIGILASNFVAVHAVQIAHVDIAIMKKSRVSIAHCPRSNRETGVGRMALSKFLDAGITVGLGTDSLASSPNLNMWDEMRYACKIHKKDGITAKDIFRLATIGGARALGMGKEIGTIEAGKKADLIAVPLPKKNTGDIYSDLLRETDSCIMSMVNGEIIFRR